MNETDEDTIWMHSHVSSRDGQPYVVMNWGRLSTQWTVEETLAHAQSLVECAHAAQSDALVAWILNDAGAKQETVAAFLARMRRLRGASRVSSEKRSSDVRHGDAGPSASLEVD